MQLTGNVEDLRRAFGVAMAGVKPNSPEPIRSCVLIRADHGDGSVTLESNNNELAFSIPVAGMVAGIEGRAAVVGHLMAEILRVSRPGPIALAMGPGAADLAVRADQEYEVTTHDAAMFPKARGLSVPRSFQCDAAAMARAITRILPVDGDIEVRFGGVDGALFDWASGVVTLAAFDGVRFAKSSFPAVLEDGRESINLPGPVVGYDSLKAIRRFGNAAGGVVEFGCDGFSARLQSANGGVMVFRLSEKRFRLWRKDPRPTPIAVIKIPADFLRQTFEQASVFLTKETRRINIQILDNHLRLSTGATAKGRVLGVKIDVDHDGPEANCTCSGENVMEALAPLGAEEVEFRVGGPLDPLVIRAGEYEHLISAMEVSP